MTIHFQILRHVLFSVSDNSSKRRIHFSG